MRCTRILPIFLAFRLITSSIARCCSAHSVAFATGSGCLLEGSIAMSTSTFFTPE